MLEIDAYAVLGLPPTATTEEVTARYREEAQAEHPDKGGTGERMAQLNIAREILLDPEQRARYDAVRKRASRLKLDAETADDPLLTRIKESIAGRPANEIAQIRRDITAHVRGLEPYLASDGARAELARRFDKDSPQQPKQQALRLERHRKELQYLDALLSTLDPILAAQAAAGI
jgi:curved DNA-binding protein CbpA